jgi:hypothetical protein
MGYCRSAAVLFRQQILRSPAEQDTVDPQQILRSPGERILPVRFPREETERTLSGGDIARRKR